MIVTAPRGLLVSDVDSTFLTQEVIELVADHAGTRDAVQAVTEAAMRGELDFAQSLHQRVSTLAGLPVGVLEDVRRALVPTPGALELVQRCREAGVVVALVSGGFHEAIDDLAREAGVDHVLANRFEIEDGRLTGKVLGPVVDGAAKEAALRAFAQEHAVPMPRTIAVGDGANDRLMVEAAGLGIAFCGKPALREAADVCVDSRSLLDIWPHMEEQLARA